MLVTFPLSPSDHSEGNTLRCILIRRNPSFPRQHLHPFTRLMYSRTLCQSENDDLIDEYSQHHLFEVSLFLLLRSRLLFMFICQSFLPNRSIVNY